MLDCDSIALITSSKIQFAWKSKIHVSEPVSCYLGSNDKQINGELTVTDELVIVEKHTITFNVTKNHELPVSRDFCDFFYMIDVKHVCRTNIWLRMSSQLISVFL